MDRTPLLKDKFRPLASPRRFSHFSRTSLFLQEPRNDGV
jgi:hypothetical protein